MHETDRRDSQTVEYYQGEHMPIPILDETEFWKVQEAEHVTVILDIVDDLEPEFVAALLEMEKRLWATRAETVRYIEALARLHGKPSYELLDEIMYLIHEAKLESKEFIALFDRIIDESAAVAANDVAQTVINHIRRESEYYVGIVDAFQDMQGRY